MLNDLSLKSLKNSTLYSSEQEEWLRDNSVSLEHETLRFRPLVYNWNVWHLEHVTQFPFVGSMEDIYPFWVLQDYLQCAILLVPVVWLILNKWPTLFSALILEKIYYFFPYIKMIYLKRFSHCFVWTNAHLQTWRRGRAL